MTEIARHPAFFANFLEYNDGTNEESLAAPEGELPAVIEQQYRKPLLHNASDYSVAVERFEISLNRVPWKEPAPAGTTPWAIAYTPVAGGALPLVPPTPFAISKTYSLTDALLQINKELREPFAITAGWPVGQLGPVWLGIDAFGFIVMHFEQGFLNGGGVTVPPDWQLLLGLGRVPQPPGFTIVGPESVLWVSAEPRWDLGDQISHIQIISTLPTVSDSVGQARANILADVAVPNPSSISFGGFPPTIDDVRRMTFQMNDVPRTRLIYIPTQRRMIRLRSSQPINDIKLTCVYVTTGGLSRTVPLPLAGVFSCKLGFFSMKGQSDDKDTLFQSYASPADGYMRVH